MKKHLFTAILLILVSCQETERSVPVPADDAAPPPISNVKVKSLPGGATITYNLPKTNSLLYVLAVYSIRNGVELEKKSSYYNSRITIEGFPDTKTYDVKLYAVSRGDKRSEPVMVKVKPLTPPVVSAFRSLKMEPAFGGVTVRFLNKSQAKIKINVLTTDSLGDLYTADIFYTERDSGLFSSRGFDSISRKFGVFIRDRWNNYSDTVFADIKPFYEEELDKTKFAEVHLNTDTYTEHCCGGGKGMLNLWDGVWGLNVNVFHTKPNTGMPQWFTLDLGDTMRLSRFKLYHRGTSGGTDGAYYAGDPKEIEIWGSNDPASDGSWGSWTLLGHYECREPSAATPTSEDIQFACVDGENFDFPIDIPPVRYIRFKTLETWGGVTYVYMAELTFFGSEK